MMVKHFSKGIVFHNGEKRQVKLNKNKKPFTKKGFFNQSQN